jgi:hypothetical protein
VCCDVVLRQQLNFWDFFKGESVVDLIRGAAILLWRSPVAGARHPRDSQLPQCAQSRYLTHTTLQLILYWLFKGLTDNIDLD